MKLYTASSWRNERYPEIVQQLKEKGHEIYNFRDANSWFRWEQIDAGWESWENFEFRVALEHPLAQRAFKADFDGMNWADACVLIMPCGRSAHIEAGYMKGKGKPLYILLDGEKPRAELTYSIANGIFENVPGLLSELAELEMRDICERCGCDVFFEECYDCGGEGYSHHDCGEDTCACLEPEPNVVCELCEGEGYLSQCQCNSAEREE